MLFKMACVIGVLIVLGLVCTAISAFLQTEDKAPHDDEKEFMNKS